MALSIVEQDILQHINPEDSLYNKATLVQGCATIFGELGISLQLCWEIKGNEVCVSLKMSAFGFSADLGNACLTVGQTTTIGGHIDSVAKAEVTLTLESDLSLCFEAKACAKPPIFGSWKCADTGKHCISL